MMPPPAHPKKQYGGGAVQDHTSETMVHSRRRQRRIETAAVLEARPLGIARNTVRT